MVAPIENRTDHLGHVFDSTKDMCEYWGISRRTYNGRLEAGWTIEEILTTKPRKKPKSNVEKRTDHLGQIFPRIKDMCDHWKVHKCTYNDRVNKFGWTKEEALTGIKISNIEKRTDHLGQVFPTQKAMCDHWGVDNNNYLDRITKTNWSKEEALTGIRTKGIEKRTDHLGQVFDNVKQMCDHWKVRDTTYANRIIIGWTKEEALTGIRKKDFEKLLSKRTDHTGRVFETQKDMFSFWNINDGTYLSRIKAGWDKEEALTGIRKEGIELRTDHLGQVFNSQQAMCDHWNISQILYSSRRRHGDHSKEECLGIIPVLKPKMKKNSVVLSNLIVEKFAYQSEDKKLYFKCKYNNKTIILSNKEIVDIYRKEVINNANS